MGVLYLDREFSRNRGPGARLGLDRYNKKYGFFWQARQTPLQSAGDTQSITHE